VKINTPIKRQEIVLFINFLFNETFSLINILGIEILIIRKIIESKNFQTSPGKGAREVKKNSIINRDDQFS
jgi:hypothetical protein